MGVNPATFFSSNNSRPLLLLKKVWRPLPLSQSRDNATAQRSPEFSKREAIGLIVEEVFLNIES